MAMALALVVAGTVAGAGDQDACAAVPASGNAPAELYAVVVGHNGGAAGLPNLRFADDDAVRFWFLLSGLAGAPARAHVTLLTTIDADTRTSLERAGLRPRPDAAPTRTGVLSAIDAVRRQLAARPADAPRPIFYFIYAGHGLAGRILLDAEGPGEAALTGHELRAAVAALAEAAPELRAYVFLDACRSQSLFTERGTNRDDALGPDLSGEAAALEERARAAPIGVLTAAFSGRPAGEVRSLGAGYFSHVLASGLAGAADADGNRVVSFAELAAFVAYNTERLTAQRPWFSPPNGDMGAAVVDLRGGLGHMELGGVPPGRYLVQAASGRPIFVEAVKAARRPLRLTLPTGHYRVLRATSEGSGLPATADVELTSGVALDLATSTWNDTSAATATADRGDDADGMAPVFGSAFTPEAVSTLTAAYHAGREQPVDVPARAHVNAVALGIGVGSAPAGLTGLEPAATLRYRRRVGRAFFGVLLAHGRSSHTADDAYRLERTTALVEAGWLWSPAKPLELALGLGAGGGPLLRRQDGAPLAGDGFVPTLGWSLTPMVRVNARCSIFLDLRFMLQWVRIDDARRGSTGVAGHTGLSWNF